MNRHFMGADGEREADLISAAITGNLTLDADNNIVLEPDNHIPNPNLTEREDGEPTGYDLSGLPAQIDGYYVNMTPEGLPQAMHLMRQNTHVIGTDEVSYTQESEIVPGYRVSPTSERKADNPLVELVPTESKGFVPGPYGLAYGYSQQEQLLRKPAKPRKRSKPRGRNNREQERRRKEKQRQKNRKGMGPKRTPTTGIRYFALTAGQIPRVFLPDTHPTGATHIDIYLTKPGGKVLFLQISVPISELRSFVDVFGPLKTTLKAQARNTTGIESPRPYVRGRDFRIRRVAGMNLREGIYSPAPAFQLAGGVTEAARPSGSIEVAGDRELRKVGEEEVPVDTASGMDSGEAVGRFTAVTAPGGISDRQAHRELGHHLWEAMATRAKDLAPGESIRSDAPGLRAEAQDAMESEANSDPGSRVDEAKLHRAYGKLYDTPYAEAGGKYLGHEIDDEEGHVVRMMNEARAEEGLDPLILNRHLTRRAYREAGGERPTPRGEYPFSAWSESIETTEDSPEVAFAGLSDPEDLRGYLDAQRAACVGIAREQGEDDRFVWVVVYGERVVTWDDVEEEEPDGHACEVVDAEGNTHRYVDDERVMVIAPDGSVTGVSDAGGMDTVDNIGPTNSGHAVRNNKVVYSYSGSHSTTLDAGFLSWNGKSAVVWSRGSGAHVAVSDGSLPSGVYGRAYVYEDNSAKVIGNSDSLFRNIQTTNEGMWRHEAGHVGKLAHNEGDSCMQSNINPDIRSVRPVDERTMTSVWGAGTGTTNPTTPTDPTDPTTPAPETETRPIYEMVNLGYKRNACIEIDHPDLMRGNANPALRVIHYVYYESRPGATDETGTGTGRTCYRLYPRNATPRTPFNNVGQFKHHVRWSGFPPESAQPGEAVRSVQEDPPEENTTRVTAPDPTSLPDVPSLTGRPIPDPGAYLVSVNALYTDGTVSKESEPQRIQVTQDRLIRVTFPTTTNIIPNANFSQVDAKGIPVGFVTGNTSNVPTNTATVPEAGVVTIEATATTNSAPYLDSRRIPIATDSPLTIAGTIALERLTNGMASVVIRQYDGSGNDLGGITCGSVSSVFEVPFERTILPTERNENCASVAVRLAISAASGGVNARASFKLLRGFEFASDVRQVAFGEGEEMDSFEPSPERPFPLSSYIASGEPPVPPGGELETVDDTELVLTHSESALPAGVSEAIANGAGGGVVTTTPIHGTHSHRSEEFSNTVNRVRCMQYDLAHSGQGVRRQIAMRRLYRFDVLPTMGSGFPRVYFHEIRSSSFALICYLGASRDGNLILFVVLNGRAYETLLGVSVSAGQVFDVETVFTGGSAGQIVVSFAPGKGQTREVVFRGNYNFTNVWARYLRMGATGLNDVKAHYALTSDEGVVTPGGDVPRRENPPTPPDYTPAPPDRPRRSSSAYRIETQQNRDGEHETAPQVYAFLRPGDIAAAPDGVSVIPLFQTPVFVWPGLSYTFAAFVRYTVFSDVARFRVRLSGDGVDDLVIDPTETDDGGLGNLTGKRSWHPSGRPTAYEDDYLIFSVPDPTFDVDTGEMLAYTGVQIELVAPPGVYVWQEHLLTRGVLTTFAERESKRTLMRSTAGSFTTILDMRPPAYEVGLTGAGIFASEFGVTSVPGAVVNDVPTTEVRVDYSTSADGFTYSTSSPYPEDLAYLAPVGESRINDRKPERYVRYEVAMTGDGYETPRIVPGGVHLRTWTPLPQLLRADGSPFPGGAWVGGVIVEEDYPDVSYERVAGRVARVRETEDVSRIGELVFSVFTEEARREISTLARTEDLMLTVPHAGGAVAGRVYRIRPGAPVEWDSGDTTHITLSEGDRTYRRLTATGKIAESEVLSYGELTGARSAPVDVAAPVVYG